MLVENAYRNLAKAIEEKGQLTPEEYKRLSIDSAKQVGRAIFFSELIILVSFLPVFMLTRQEGKLFHLLAYTKSFALIGSAIVVISLIPVLMTMLMHCSFPYRNWSSIFFLSLLPLKRKSYETTVFILVILRLMFSLGAFFTGINQIEPIV